jgi:hypothetical protein
MIAFLDYNKIENNMHYYTLELDMTKFDYNILRNKIYYNKDMMKGLYINIIDLDKEVFFHYDTIEEPVEQEFPYKITFNLMIHVTELIDELKYYENKILDVDFHISKCKSDSSEYRLDLIMYSNNIESIGNIINSNNFKHIKYKGDNKYEYHNYYNGMV